MLPLFWLVLLVTGAVIGTIANALIVIATFCSRSLQTGANAFVVNLAAADIIITAFILPLAAASWWVGTAALSDAFCNVSAFFLVTACAVSMQSAMLLAVERFLHICKHRWYRKLCTKPAMTFYLLSTWVHGAIWACQGWSGWTLFAPHTLLCAIDPSASLSYNILASTMLMLLPITILFICYVSIILRVRASRKTVAAHSVPSPHLHIRTQSNSTSRNSHKMQLREKKMVVTLSLTIAASTLCWLPAAVSLILTPLTDLPWPIINISFWLAISSSCLNGWLYGFSNPNFRKSYRKLFCKCYHSHKNIAITNQLLPDDLLGRSNQTAKRTLEHLDRVRSLRQASVVLESTSSMEVDTSSAEEHPPRQVKESTEKDTLIKVEVH